MSEGRVDTNASYSGSFRVDHPSSETSVTISAANSLVFKASLISMRSTTTQWTWEADLKDWAPMKWTFKFLRNQFLCLLQLVSRAYSTGRPEIDRGRETTFVFIYYAGQKVMVNTTFAVLNEMMLRNIFFLLRSSFALSARLWWSGTRVVGIFDFCRGRLYAMWLSKVELPTLKTKLLKIDDIEKLYYPMAVHPVVQLMPARP